MKRYGGVTNVPFSKEYRRSEGSFPSPPRTLLWPFAMLVLAGMIKSLCNSFFRIYPRKVTFLLMVSQVSFSVQCLQSPSGQEPSVYQPTGTIPLALIFVQ